MLINKITLGTPKGGNWSQCKVLSHVTGFKAGFYCIAFEEGYTYFGSLY